MAKIEQWIIDKVKDAADIVDVVGDFVTLRKAGVNYTGLCPFHDDQTDGNFMVRPKGLSNGGNTYHCFVCHKRGGGGGPVDFLMKCPKTKMSFVDAIRYLGKKYCIEVDDVPVNFTPPPPKPTPPPKPRITFKRQTVKDSMEGVNQTLFVKWLSELNWNDEQRARLAQTLRMYCVASCTNGYEWVRFWQITHEGVPLTAKWMRYKADGHRVKGKNPNGSNIYANDWEHAWRARTNQYDESKYDTSGRALFGAHLLKSYSQAIVNVVESEKTALIMANYYGHPEQQLWLACGGLEWLQLSAMQPLIDQGRTVWLWPDKDGVEKWQEVADKLGSDKVQVYSRFFETCWTEADGDKADCADITIRMMTTGERPREIREVRVSQGTAEKDFGNASDQSTALAPEPFIDPVELADPRVREWRERMSHVHSCGWGKWPTSKVEGVKSVGEILDEHPIIKKLIGD